MSQELSLSEICLVYRTDKNCVHSYVDNVYEELFRDVRHSTKKLLEIGVEGGGSLLMWREYFPNAEIFGIDEKPCGQLGGRERIRTFEGDAYEKSMVDLVGEDFDIIIEDGPHTLKSILFVVEEYINKLAPGGILVVEDFQDFDWTNVVRRKLKGGLEAEVRDLRKIKGRYDDILMVIRKL